MTDLEIAKLCADAMGLELGPDWNQGPSGVMLGGYSGIRPSYYDPLQDDAQAMALVKRFRMHVQADADGWWAMETVTDELVDGPNDADLNRAICLCVASLHAARAGK